MKTDHLIQVDPDVTIWVREVAQPQPDKGPVLLVHGGGPGGLPSFDLPVPGYSVAEDLATAGHVAYVMDVRGWGGSTRLPELDQPVDANAPLVTSEEAVRDLGAVVDWIRKRSGDQSIALVGWATGGHWCGMYTSRNPDSVSHLAMLNSLYGVSAPWGLRAAFEHPDRPGELDRAAGAYRKLTASALLGSWDRTIPIEDKSVWREPAVAAALQQAAMESDPTSQTREPPSVRVPAGFQGEAYLMARGMKFWDAQDIYVPTLVMRGDLDHWSRPEDVTVLQQELVNAPKVTTLTIPGGTHYLFLDRPERGRARLLHEVTTFLEC